LRLSPQLPAAISSVANTYFAADSRGNSRDYPPRTAVLNIYLAADSRGYSRDCLPSFLYLSIRFTQNTIPAFFIIFPFAYVFITI
jgi:hypothetical protein